MLQCTRLPKLHSTLQQKAQPQRPHKQDLSDNAQRNRLLVTEDAPKSEHTAKMARNLSQCKHKPGERKSNEAVHLPCYAIARYNLKAKVGQEPE
jgi:hypothetical protein